MIALVHWQHDFLDLATWIWLGCGWHQYLVTGGLMCCATHLVGLDGGIKCRYSQIVTKMKVMLMGPIE